MRAVAKGVILAMALAPLISPSAQAAQVTSGLLVDINVANPSSYSGTGTVLNDLAGTNNSATLTNGPTFQSSGGNAIVTDGTNDYLEIANTSELQPSLGSSFTLQIYGQLNSFVAGEGILSKQYGVGGGYDGYSLMLTGTNGLALYMNGASVNGNYSSANNVFSLNTWTLFTIVVRLGGGPSNQSKVYVNTTEVVSASNSESGISQSQAPIRIASGLHEGTPYSAMKIGAFAMYNRALTSAEISDNLDYYTNYVPDNTAPTITSSSTFAVNENQTTIGTLTSNETSTWTLRPSADSATVSINSSSGILTFKSAPNYESPTDSDLNNVYSVNVRATDTAGNTADATLSITVIDIDESTTISPSLSTSPKKGTALNILITSSQAGKVSVSIQGRRLLSCSNRSISASPSQLICPWKPAVTGVQTLRIAFTPNDSNYASSNAVLTALVTKRTGLR
jgi:hypothetical protein